MNERIKELAEQASFRQFFMPKSNSASALDKFNGTFTEQEAIEKFAELIVRECIEISNQHPSKIFKKEWDADAVAWDITQRIKGRFGVEE